MALTYFSQDEIAKIAQETLSQLPDGHKNAVVGTVDASGVKVASVFTLGTNNRWQVDGVYEHNWAGDNAAGANVIYSW